MSRIRKARKNYKLGRIIQDPQPGNAQEPFQLTDEELNTHTLILGTTGAGKSRLIRQIIREHRRNRRGICVIDPGNDLIDDTLADVAYEYIVTGNRDILKTIHLVELSPFQLARYDPFRFNWPKQIHPEMWKTVYRAWQHTKVLTHAENLQWKQGQSTTFDGMPRLQRIAVNVFTAVTTLVDGKRLSAGDADILIDLGHPRHFDVYEKIRPRLERRIVADFEVLHHFRSVKDIRTENESFLNRIRSSHGCMLKEMISSTGDDPTLDLHGIIQRGETLLVACGKTPFASEDENLALGGMFIHDIIDAMLITPRELRRNFTLVIDELHKHARAGLGDMARTGRKFGLGFVGGTPDLASLRHGGLDLASEFLNVVNTVIAFRMSWPEDTKLMAEILYAQNIDFTELVHEVERRAGQEWLEVTEWSENYTKSTGKATNNSTTDVEGSASQEASGSGSQRKRTVNYDALGRRVGSSVGEGDNDTRSGSQTKNKSKATQQGMSEQEGESHGITINHKLVHLEKYLREKVKTGMLDRAVADQFARYAQKISGQSQRRATARVRAGKAIEFETEDVKDPFRSPDAQAKAVEMIKRELYQIHPYFFTPNLDESEIERRIVEFLRDCDDEGQVKKIGHIRNALIAHAKQLPDTKPEEPERIERNEADEPKKSPYGY